MGTPIRVRLDLAAAEPRSLAPAPPPPLCGCPRTWWGFPPPDRRATVRAASRSVRPARCRPEPGISTFENVARTPPHHPARPIPKDSPCLALSTASATSPDVTRGGSSPRGSSSPSPRSCSTAPSAAAPTRASAFPDPTSQRAADAIEDRFPQETLYTSNVIFHSEDGITDPGREGRDRAGRHRTRRRYARHRREQSLRPAWADRERGRAHRLRDRRLRHEKVGADEFDAAEKATQDVRDAGIQVEYDGGLGYAKGDAGRRQRDDRHPRRRSSCWPSRSARSSR